MNTAQEFINRLYQEKSNYTHPSQAKDLANSLDTISDDIYSESERFVYELIQNADDACKNSELGVEIYIEFTNNFVIISHTGKEFSEADIRAISSVGGSQKTKNINQTGYKGIGFKSVFGISELVYIKYHNFSFKFDKQYWLDRYEYKMPWQIIPIWNNNLENELHRSKSFGKHPVSTAIRHGNPKQLKKELLTLLKNTEVILFLRNVQKITIDHPSFFLLEKTSDRESNLTTIKRNRTIQSQWIVKNFTGISIPEEIIAEIKNDDKTPKKLKESKYTNLSFAAQIISQGKLRAIPDRSIIFTYLPTKIQWGLPFLVNADFLTNAAREMFHKDRIWNQWLFNTLAIKVFEWIAELANTPKYKYQITSLIPKRLYGHDDILKRCFNKGRKDAIENIAFVPNEQGDLLRIKESFLDDIGLSEIIRRDKLIQYCNKQYSVNLSISSFIEEKINNTHKLKKIGSFVFDLDKLVHFLNREDHIKFINRKNNIDFIRFLYQNSKQQNIKLDIKTIPLILDEHEILTSPDKIYVPIESLEFSFEELQNCFQFIHKSVWQDICKYPEIKQWLSHELNIQEPTKKNIIEKTILPNIQTLSNTKEKSIKLVRYLFNAYREGTLEESVLSKLKFIKLIRKSEELKSACYGYLADKYSPNIFLEEYLNKGRFISEEYIGHQDNIKEWNIFLTQIGVREKIELINIHFNPKRKEVEINHPDYLKYIDEEYNINTNSWNIEDHYFNDYQFIPWINEIQNNDKLSRIFWEHVIDNWSEFINQRTKYFVNQQEYFEIITQFEYFITHKNCIPTTTGECYRHNEVILNQEDLKTIGGSFLPILDLDIALPEQVREFFDFKKDITLDQYLDTLGYISQQEYENKERSQLIYRIELIYDALSKFDRDYEQNKIREWSQENKILATDGKFYSPKDLSFITLDSFDNPVTIDRFVKLPKQNNKTIGLLKNFGVNLIGKENLDFEIDGAYKDSELQRHIIKRLPLIALLLAKTKSSSWTNEFDRLKKIIDTATFYQADRIHILFKYADRDLIRQKQYSCLDRDKIYYVGKWERPLTLFSLIDNLSELLHIRKFTKKLNLLLLEDFEICLEWLKEQGYDINLISQEGLTIQSDVETISFSEATEQEPRERTESQKEYDRETGWLGEKFVFDRIKEMYQNKYGVSDLEIEDTLLGFKIQDIEVIWNNKCGESGKNHDLKIKQPHKHIINNKLFKEIEHFVEVKSTTTNESSMDNIPFYFSINEWNLMNSSDRNYLVARVFNTRTNPSMKLIKFQDEIS